MRRKWLILAAFAAVTLSIVAVTPSIAYFTDTVQTEGKIEVKLGDGKPEIDENVKNMTKYVTIKNTGDYDIFVRAKAIYPDTCTVTLENKAGWKSGNNDGYYYYDAPVAPGASTESELTLKIENSSELDFNVVIVQEATKVVYDENGNPKPADWTNPLTTQTEIPQE